MRFKIWRAGILALSLALVQHDAVAQSADVIRIGGLCDRTGESKLIGLEYCPGVVDYIALVNRKGGVLGHKLEYTEIDHAYTPERAIDGYERLKRDGAVTIMNYGVPDALALTPRYMADRIPAFNSGTGRGDAIDGEAWPYIFPGVASYWSQAGVVMKYLKDNGAKKGTKIAYLYFDNPAGRDGIAMVEAVARRKDTWCASSRCNRPASRSRVRSTTSPATSSRTGSWRACSGSRRPWPSRNSGRQAFR